MPVAHESLGEYLAEHDPVQALWHHLADLVAQDSSRPVPTQEFSRAAGTIYLVGLFEGEVVQGGFRQFLTNPSGNYARETLEALQAVGAHVCAELLEKAMTPFPGGIAPGDHDSRLSMIGQLETADPDFLAPFDELYMQHVDAQSPHRVENLTTLLLDYLKENASEPVTG